MLDSLAPQRTFFLLCGILGGYLLLMTTNPVRDALRDGWRANRRYPLLWRALGVLGFAYETFTLCVRLYFHFALPPSERPEFVWVREAWSDPDLRLAGLPQSLWWLPREDLITSLRAAVLPSVENLAGLFNNAIITFPLASLAAILLLVNWGGHHRVLNRALRKRFGLAGWLVHAGILACALAAIAKPLLYAAPQLLAMGDRADAARLWFQWAPVAEWLAFLFEYLFGIFIQLYLILLAFVWIRGLTFTHQHLVDFALRRFSFVVKWAAIVMLLSSIFLNAPLILKNFAPFAQWLPEEIVLTRYHEHARFWLAIFLLLTATMQITLTFHSESLRAALRDHLKFLARFWWPLFWFLAVALAHLFAVQAVNTCICAGLGEGTALWVAWKLIFPWLAAIVTGWLLASWVSIFHRCDTGRARAEERIRF